MIDVDCFIGAAGSAKPPTVYVYSYGNQSRYVRYLAAEIDLMALRSKHLDAARLMKLVATINDNAARVDDVVTVLAKALHRSQERLFTYLPLCECERAGLISTVRATGTALHHLTDTIGPLAFTEYKGEALRDY